MAVTVSDRLLTVGRGRDREGLMPAIAGCMNLLLREFEVKHTLSLRPQLSCWTNVLNLPAAMLSEHAKCKANVSRH